MAVSKAIDFDRKKVIEHPIFKCWMVRFTSDELRFFHLPLSWPGVQFHGFCDSLYVLQFCTTKLFLKRPPQAHLSLL